MNTIPIPKNALTQIMSGAAMRPTIVAPNERTNPAQTRKVQLLVCELRLPDCIVSFFDETILELTTGGLTGLV